MLLKEIFKRYKDRRFIFVEQGGNHGDFLIYAGAKKLANEVGIKFNSFSFDRKINSKEFLKNLNLKKKINQLDIFYLHGSGGFNSMHNWSPQVLNILRNLFPENLIIVGPSSAELESRYHKQVLPRDKNIIFLQEKKQLIGL